MNAPAQRAENPPPPLPPNQFKWFMLFWHVFLLGGLVFTLCLAIERQPGAPAWRWAALGGLIVAQGWLYLRTFPTRASKTVSPGGWAVYFASSLVLWVVEFQLDSYFEWVLWAYLGQMLGALPPRRSLPALVLVLGTYLGWRFSAGGIPRVSGWVMLGFGGAVVSWVGMALFMHRLAVTSADRAKLIQELQAAQRELEQARDREAELAVLRERERLARDLHDGLGHALVTLSVQLEAVQRLCAVDPAKAAALIEEMKRLTRSSTEALRRSLANLRAPGLGDRRLTEALRACGEEAVGRTHWQLSCALDERANELPARVAEALWRVGQEGLANIERHAAAKCVSLQLALDSNEVSLRVQDDGVGLTGQPENKPGHFGLRGLRERVEGLGGTLALSAGQPRGTVVEARLPVVT
jgi:signal transduction histidine kinase